MSNSLDDVMGVIANAFEDASEPDRDDYCPDCGADPASTRCHCDWAGRRVRRRLAHLEERLAEATAILEAYPYPSEIDNPNAGKPMRRLCLWTDGHKWLDWTDRRKRFLHPEGVKWLSTGPKT